VTTFSHAALRLVACQGQPYWRDRSTAGRKAARRKGRLTLWAATLSFSTHAHKCLSGRKRKRCYNGIGSLASFPQNNQACTRLGYGRGYSARPRTRDL